MTDDIDAIFDQPDQSELIQKFEEKVTRYMRAIAAPKVSVEKKVKAIQWLGESGSPKAIPVLSRVYEREKRKGRKANHEMLEAAAYALGQFRALENFIDREPGESISDALERDENEIVMSLLTQIATQGRKGQRKPISAGVLNRIAGVLVFTLVVLLALNLMGGGGGGGGDESPAPGDDPQGVIVPPQSTEIIPAPEATPEPVGPSATPTITPSATASPIPATPTIAPEDVAPYLQQLDAALNSVTQPRGAVELLSQYWNDASVAGRTVGCDQPRPDIPGSVDIPSNLLNEVPGLREAQQNVNTLLTLVNTGWDSFFAACAAETLAEQAPNGLSIVEAIEFAVPAARNALRPLQQQYRVLPTLVPTSTP